MIWDERLLPRLQVEPAGYYQEERQPADDISLDDLKEVIVITVVADAQFFIDYLKNDVRCVES